VFPDEKVPFLLLVDRDEAPEKPTTMVAMEANRNMLGTRYRQGKKGKMLGQVLTNERWSCWCCGAAAEGLRRRVGRTAGLGCGWRNFWNRTSLALTGLQRKSEVIQASVLICFEEEEDWRRRENKGGMATSSCVVISEAARAGVCRAWGGTWSSAGRSEAARG
jgi:hypothetical protein